jgi:hypothetical protein
MMQMPWLPGIYYFPTNDNFLSSSEKNNEQHIIGYILNHIQMLQQSGENTSQR